jgi:hypothetical protein
VFGRGAQWLTASEAGGSVELVDADVERRRASGAVAAAARRIGERTQQRRGTLRAGTRAWRRSRDAMGSGGARSGREAERPPWQTGSCLAVTLARERLEGGDVMSSGHRWIRS